MKIVLFCNHQVSLSALHDLVQRKFLAGIVTSNFGHGFCDEVTLLSQVHKVPYFQCGMDHLEGNLVDWLEGICPDVVMVVTFPFRLPKVVLDLPPMGCWNFHSGLLPAYRGPDPVFWQIRNGESHGGLTVHRMAEKFDTGAVLFEKKVPLAANDVLGTHMGAVAQVIPEGIKALMNYLESGDGALREQDEKEACYRSRPNAEDLTIDWETMDSTEIGRLIRAANPSYQGVGTMLCGATVSLHEVEVIPLADPPDEKPGTIVDAPGDPNLYILCRDSACLRVQVASVTDAVCSGVRLRELFKLKSGERFESATRNGEE